MDHFVLVKVAAGRELDDLRRNASSIAKQCKSDWSAEPASRGTVFCFETSNAGTAFQAFCAKAGIEATVSECVGD